MKADRLLDYSMQEVIDLMISIYNVDLSVYSVAFLEKSILNRCKIAEVICVSDYFNYIKNNPMEALALERSLNITYTDFFRDPLAFEIFEQRILPNLIIENKPTKEIRIWSAGCSSGQEPYSIAMVMENYIALNAKRIRYRIIATDICEDELEFANKGEFQEKSVQNIKLKQLNEFFEKRGNTFVISSRLKEKISFSKYDLLDRHSVSPKESIFGEFDVIFCKNLLIYYDSEYQQLFLQKLMNSLTDDGYLILGEAERHLLNANIELQAVVIKSMFLKKSRGERL